MIHNGENINTTLKGDIRVINRLAYHESCNRKQILYVAVYANIIVVVFISNSI